MGALPGQDGNTALAQTVSHRPVFSRALPPEFLEFLAKGSVPKGSVAGLGQQAARADLHHRGLPLQPREWDGVGRASQVKDSYRPVRPEHPGGAQSPLHFPQELVPQNSSLWGGGGGGRCYHIAPVHPRKAAPDLPQGGREGLRALQRGRESLDRCPLT